MQLPLFLPVLDMAANVCPLPFDARARVLLLAIAGQESGWEDRVQQGGPARSFWQFEIEAVQAVLSHKATAPALAITCTVLNIQPNPNVIYNAIAYQDVLATVCARALLWCDPAPLPDVDDITGAWAYYQRNWRPGKPGPDRWPGVHDKAAAALGLTVPGAAA